MIVIGENSVGDARDVEAIIEALRDAGRAVERSDPDGVAAMFDPGDEATIFDFLAPGICGVEDIRRNVAGIAQTAVGEVVCTYPKVTVRTRQTSPTPCPIPRSISTARMALVSMFMLP
ncbi:hypothetical protein [Flavisphingomonas formosensis]|uniref:hypothetical protein n=1 Tax=Flavisphingomonas formosensis TaxID=861534 RepID=UPI0012F8EB42|nr:hypothetical protein [Sphingomonas formosensis]